MNSIRGLIAILVATSSFNAFGQQPGGSPCDNPKTTIEMQECASFKLKQAEKELQQVYSIMLSRLTNETHKKLFIASQEAWQKHRNTEAEFEGYFYDGGTIQLQIKLDCMTRLTQTRVKELRQLLKDEFDH